MSNDLMGFGFIKQKRKSLNDLTPGDEVFVEMVAMDQRCETISERDLPDANIVPFSLCVCMCFGQ
jgi:hypothetical protein